MLADWHPSSQLWQIIGYWQTIITGFLAIIAAFGTIWATIRSADREIDAANRQINTAQKQIDTTVKLDREHAALEEKAFLVALAAAVCTVIDSVNVARLLLPAGIEGDVPHAYKARQRVKITIFPDLRPAVVRLGGSLAPVFITLDQTISSVSSNWTLPSGGVSHTYAPVRIAPTLGLHEELDKIEQLAKQLAAANSERLAECLKRLPDQTTF